MQRIASDLAILFLATTAIFEQGVVALGALTPPVNPLAFSLAWLAEGAILLLLTLALGRPDRGDPCDP